VRRGLAWLAHPITLAALLALVVNDHVLKAAYPGPVTGKLRDVAGLVVAPPLLALLTVPLLRRWGAAVAVVVVGVGFAVVKAVPAAAGVASAAWSVLRGPSLVRADLTDLVALPALGLAWYVWVRSSRSVTLELCAGKSDNTPRISARSRERLALMVVLPLALIGVAATTAKIEHFAIATGVGPGIGGDAVILVGRDGVTATSSDGRHWTPTPMPSASAGEEPTLNYDTDAIANARDPHRLTCTKDGSRCYRVVPDRLAIEESIDGGLVWTTVWSISDRDRARYAEVFAEDAPYDRSYHGDIHDDLTCRTVHIVRDTGVVIAACGLVGFVSGDGDATWTMVGFAGHGTDLPNLRRFTPAENRRWFRVLMLAWFVLLLGAETHAVTHPLVRRRRALAVGRVAAAVVTSVAVAENGTILGDSEDVSGWLIVLGFSVWFVLYLFGRPNFPWWVLPAPAIVSLGNSMFFERLTMTTPDPTLGWVVIWLVLAIGLVANAALGLLPRRRLSTEGATP
jgi:hypothetical protein